MPDNLTRDEARLRARLLDDVAYDVRIDLTTGEETFASTTVVHFSCSEPGADTFVDLDARQLQAATLNGEPVPAEAFDGSQLRLEGLREENELEVSADCVYQRTGVGLHRFTDPVDGQVYLHTQFEPFDAHRMYACFDQPDLKAPFTLRVNAPAGWLIVSNEPAIERPDDGAQGWWRFPATPPLSTYVTAVVAGPFHEVRDRHGELDLGVFCRQSLAPHLDEREIFEITRQGLDFFETAFGRGYPFTKYDQLFVPEFNWGAMENVGCVTFSESYVFRAKVTEGARLARASTILHELAHMWFGNLVTMRWWDDLWLNESFATYMGTLALAEATRFKDAWVSFATGQKAWAIAQDQLPTTHPIVADIVDTDATRTHFDGITYAKGASVLKQLVAFVGRESFLAGLRDYFEQHAFSNAELSDFLAALAHASGRDLAAWSAEWLQTEGVAILRGESELDADGRYASFAVRQTATQAHPTLRRHRLAIGLYDDREEGITRSRRLELDVDSEETPVPELVGEFRPDLLLVNDDDLSFAKLRLDAHSLDSLAASLGRIREPLPRALCWGAAWDMVRDAELAAQRYQRLVVDHAAGEDEISLLQNLLARALAAVDRFGRPSARETARAALATRARAALEEAEPGSDRQLVWARMLVSAAVSEFDLTWANQLLDGQTEVAGLAVDEDLRWHVVQALATKGAAGPELIDAELERDPSDRGARRATAARASRPDTDAKSAAWEIALSDPTASLAMQRAAAGSFWQYGQERELEGYIDRYVQALEGIWTDRGLEESLILTELLFPYTIVSPVVLDAADAALDRDALPAPARRKLLEAEDATRRALRARAFDAE
ncbi:MAG: aminopeptidase N [Egibacteraceae bacterium]